MDEVRTEWASFKNNPTFGNGASSSTSTWGVIQISKPSTFNGNRNAMEVENFLFDLEQYFEANGVRDDATRITNAPIFLQESA
ncbi:hypothetical protein Ddye_021553 [Dipteronia dyeriana]|uniref:Uncharacterized protein n=1 Tax=Dipteronia dyeriana TaxID=168575 RepID=A0AAD9U2L3_9ROSI|nr:hypothetical protein Ddye_021553 [Dipteronia dyeriana]